MNSTILTIGVLTFNNSQSELSRWYRSLSLALQQLDSTLQVRVLSLDNGERSWLAEQPNIQSLKPIGNVGFARGVNHLMEEAFVRQGSDYFITCNPDGYFHPLCLKHLLANHLKNPKAIIEARIFPEEHPKTYDLKTGQTNWAVGCCLFIPKDIFVATLGFDTNFFLYLEDVDFSWRCRDLGFQVIFSPSSFYGHGLHGRNEGAVSRRSQLMKAGAYFAKKWNLKKELHKLEENTLLETERPTVISGKFNGRKYNEGEFFVFSKVRW